MMGSDETSLKQVDSKDINACEFIDNLSLRTGEHGKIEVILNGVKDIVASYRFGKVIYYVDKNSLNLVMKSCVKTGGWGGFDYIIEL